MCNTSILLNNVLRKIYISVSAYKVIYLFLGYGVTSDDNTIFINASTCDINYIPKNYPMVFDMDLPPGVQK